MGLESVVKPPPKIPSQSRRGRLRTRTKSPLAYKRIEMAGYGDGAGRGSDNANDNDNVNYNDNANYENNGNYGNNANYENNDNYEPTSFQRRK